MLESSDTTCAEAHPSPLPRRVPPRSWEVGAAPALDQNPVVVGPETCRASGSDDSGG